MIDPITFTWEGTGNPNDPSGIARFGCDGSFTISFTLDSFSTASRISNLLRAAYQRGKNDAIDTALHVIPKLLNEQRYD
jgi:hypothetical protein